MVGGAPIFQVSAMPLKQALAFFEALNARRPSRPDRDKIVKEIVARVGFLNNVGLDYLSLDRSADTLVGRRVAAHPPGLADRFRPHRRDVRADEPSIGLHQRDNDRLLATLKHLRDSATRCWWFEHDEDAIRAADYWSTWAPAPGCTVRSGGGRHAEAIRLSEHSLTGAISVRPAPHRHPKTRRQPDPSGSWW